MSRSDFIGLLLGSGKHGLETRNRNGRTPLHLAAMYGHESAVTIFCQQVMVAMGWSGMVFACGASNIEVLGAAGVFFCPRGQVLGLVLIPTVRG